MNNTTPLTESELVEAYTYMKGIGQTAVNDCLTQCHEPFAQLKQMPFQYDPTYREARQRA